MHGRYDLGSRRWSRGGGRFDGLGLLTIPVHYVLANAFVYRNEGTSSSCLVEVGVLRIGGIDTHSV
jgi:hypothetical protein